MSESYTQGRERALRCLGISKYARVLTPLQPHQERVRQRMQEQDGLVVAHGLGSGKTFSSIAAADALDMPRHIVVPAALKGNYQKELNTHRAEKGEGFDVQSLQKLTAVPSEAAKINNGLMVIDEAHRLRDPATKANQVFRGLTPQKRMLLTASPVYNHPADLAALVNLAAGQKVLPDDRKSFEKAYTKIEKVYPSPWQFLKGVRPGEQRVLANTDQLKPVLNQWVDYHGNAKTNTNFPGATEETISVPMSETQQDIYDTMLNKAPWWVRRKIEAGLPPSKQEAKSLNSFLTGQRQVSNSPQPYVQGMTMEEAVANSPKIQAAFNRFVERSKENPNHKAVVYSNYLQGGLLPYEHMLKKNNIPYGLFRGGMSTTERNRLVQEYNQNKIKALLLSSAGGEGLDLKGTRQVQLLDPHFNEEKIRQIIGRGVRYKSHEALPEAERNVHVERYLSEKRPGWFDRLLNRKNSDLGSDAYMAQLAQNKLKLNDQVIELLKQRDAETT